MRSEAPRVNLPETKARFQGGIVFPMRIGDDRDPFVILGNIPELSAVFETKARAPYKIVFEVCRLSELIEISQEEESKARKQAPGASVSDIPNEATEEESKEGAVLPSIQTDEGLAEQ